MFISVRKFVTYGLVLSISVLVAGCASAPLDYPKEASYALEDISRIQSPRMAGWQN